MQSGKALYTVIALLALLLIFFLMTPAYLKLPQLSQSGEDDEAASRAAAASETAEQCEKLYKAEEHADALPICRLVLDNAVAGGSKTDIARARYRHAVVLDFLERRSEAIAELHLSRKEAADSGASVIELWALNRLGTIYDSMGQFDRAIEFYSEAIALSGKATQSNTIVHAQVNRGASRFVMGDYVGALADFETTEKRYKEINHKAGRTSALINIGSVHKALGDLRFAEDLFNEALALADSPRRDPRRMAEAHHNLGFLADDNEDYEAASEHYRKALEYRGASDRRRARTLNNLGVAQGELGQYESAIEQFDEALEISRRSKQRNVEGSALDSLATVQAYQGHHSEALEKFQRALLIMEETGDRDGQRQTLANIGKQLKEIGRFELAILFYKRSVNLTESIRSELKSFSPTQQSSYTKTVSDTYRELSSLLIQQNRLLEAQRVIDLLKIQELEEFLGEVRGNEQSQAGVPQTPAERLVLDGYDALARRAVEIGREWSILHDVARLERTPQQKARMDYLDAQKTLLNDEFVRFIESEEVTEAIAEVKRRIGDEAIALSVLKDIGNQLKGLDHSAVVLYPLVLEDRLELILATPESRPIHRSVNVDRATLRTTVAEFRSALLDPSLDARPAGAKLYDWLIRPVAAELDELKVETILYAPDDALRYVPLAAFHDGDGWLIENFRVGNWTDNSRENLAEAMSTDLRILGGAYTVPGHSFSIANELFRFLGLEFAGREVDTIATLFEDTLLFPGEQFVFDDIYRERSDFNVLHLATHAAIVVGQPSDSFILFGDGGRKSIQDIKRMDFDLDLAVLSACETAVTGTDGSGVEILGLGYAMQASGVRSTVASLWRVSDGGTHALMSEFYGNLKAGKSKAEALRNAQLLLISNDRAAIASANRGVALPGKVAASLNHPFYWAPFILVGSGV